MRSFFQVAQQTERALVINLKQAYLLLFEKTDRLAEIALDLLDITSHGKKVRDDWFAENLQEPTIARGSALSSLFLKPSRPKTFDRVRANASAAVISMS